MNQKQREFLIKTVENNANKELEKLVKPSKPSLSNHIIAAVLDGSIVIKSQESIKQHIRDKVVGMKENDNGLFGRKSRSRWDDEEEDDAIFEISPSVLFEYPPAYLEKLKKFKDEMKSFLAKREEIKALKETLILKIQIGSDKILDKLVDEADNLVDLSIMKSQLVISAPKAKELSQ